MPETTGTDPLSAELAAIRKAAHDAATLPFAQAIETSPYALIDMALDAAIARIALLLSRAESWDDIHAIEKALTGEGGTS